MKRVTIYVDEAIWADIQESAWRARLSAGNYLVKLHMAQIKELEETCLKKDALIVKS